MKQKLKTMALAWALTPCLAFATTWYVDGTNGSDDNAGLSLMSAKASIQSKFGSSISKHLSYINAEERRNGVSNAYGQILYYQQLHPSGEATRKEYYYRILPFSPFLRFSALDNFYRKIFNYRF